MRSHCRKEYVQSNFQKNKQIYFIDPTRGNSVLTVFLYYKHMKPNTSKTKSISLI